MNEIDIEMERSTTRGKVDPKLDAMMQPRWSDTDPNPAFVPRPHYWTGNDVDCFESEVPMRPIDRVHEVIVRACMWLDRLFGLK